MSTPVRSPQRPNDRPRFTAVVPIYNVSEYIDEFLASLARQTSGLDDIEVVLVDDGSLDDSGDKADAFARHRPTVTVIHQDNGGLSAARNTGLAAARGEWVTFPDPDDVLADDYFENVAAFLDAHADESPDVLGTRILYLLDSEGGRISDNHPLKRKFRQGDRVASLTLEPSCVQLSGATAFFRVDRLREWGLAFDGRVRPDSEDGHLIGRYLLPTPDPRIGLIRSATYHYRRRANGTSLLQGTWARAEKYVDAPRYGYLDLLERARDSGASVPQWLQISVLYNLGWYFKNGRRNSAASAELPDSVLEEFHELAARILAHISPEVIEHFDIYPLSDEVRYVLAHTYPAQPAHHSAPRVVAVDRERGDVEVGYFFQGPPPAEAIRGATTDPAVRDATTRSVEFFRRELAQERRFWVSAREPGHITLDGAAELSLTPELLAPEPEQVIPARRTEGTPAGILRRIVPAPLKAVARRVLGRGPRAR